MNRTQTPFGTDLEAAPTETVAGPHAPTAAEVGAHFAAEIADEADAALRAAARLGPRRVLELLT